MRVRALRWCKLRKEEAQLTTRYRGPTVSRGASRRPLEIPSETERDALVRVPYIIVTQWQ